MVEILHEKLPDDLQPNAPLPGVRPLTDGAWLRVDEAYAGQMSYRRQLLAERRADVFYQSAAGKKAAEEVLEIALERLPDMGFEVLSNHAICPDGARIDLTRDAPLAVLAQLVQEDICLLTKDGDEHMLAAAALCFPANWTLAEKAGKPLTHIHIPVPEYDNDIAKRVQRLFDGVQVGRPLWRNNYLRYNTPDLFQPRPADGPARAEPDAENQGYVRAERQCILRLPLTGAVVFSIHSYVVRA